MIHDSFIWLTEQHVSCIWDKDTDEMIWWPSDIKECNGEYEIVFETIPELLITGLVYHIYL